MTFSLVTELPIEADALKAYATFVPRFGMLPHRQPCRED